MSEELFKLEELGTSKGAIKRRFFEDYDRPESDRWSERVKAMLNSKRTSFTLDELEDLIAVFDTSHHTCVLVNSEDFHPLVVKTHERLERKIEEWNRYIRERRMADAVRNLDRCHCLKNAEGVIEEASGTCSEHGWMTRSEGI